MAAYGQRRVWPPEGGYWERARALSEKTCRDGEDYRETRWIETVILVIIIFHTHMQPGGYGD
jgi:hypothetical protein